MKAEKRIPAPVFRTIALLLLLPALGLWIYWLLPEVGGPYHWVQPRLLFLGLRESQLLSVTLAFALAMGLWAIPTAILRHSSDMPPLHEAFRPSPGSSFLQDFRQGLAAQRQRQAEMVALPAENEDRRRFFRRLGWVGIGVGLGAWVVTGVVWYLSGQLWPTLLAVGLVGLFGGGLSVITGYPLIFDREKVQAIAGITQRLGLVVLALIMVGLAVLCVVDAFV